MNITRHLQHHFFGDHLNAAREVHLALRDWRLGFSRRATKEFVERAVSHAQALRVVEVVLVELDAAVVANLEQMIFDRVDVLRFAVRRESHHLVLAAVDFESGVVSERAVEQAHTVWIAKLLERVNSFPFPMPMELVAHSPTPSIVSIAASSNGEG